MILYHTVNAGLYFHSNSTGIFIDGLHAGEQVGFSSMPETLWPDLTTLDNLYFFTHCHEDHFQKEKIQKLLRFQPTAPVWSPQYDNNIVDSSFACSDSFCLQKGPFSLSIFQASHIGSAFHDISVYVPLVSYADKRYLISSDAFISAQLVNQIQQHYLESIDGLFANLYQLADPEQLDHIQKLNPRKIFLYHLPFPSDDIYQLREQSIQLKKSLGLSVTILSPMSVVLQVPPTNKSMQ